MYTTCCSCEASGQTPDTCMFSTIANLESTSLYDLRTAAGWSLFQPFEFVDNYRMQTCCWIWMSACNLSFCIFWTCSHRIAWRVFHCDHISLERFCGVPRDSLTVCTGTWQRSRKKNPMMTRTHLVSRRSIFSTTWRKTGTRIRKNRNTTFCTRKHIHINPSVFVHNVC